MISSRKEYEHFLERDRLALSKSGKPRILGDLIWKYQRLLRKLEFYTNCKHGPLWGIFKRYLEIRFYLFSIGLGFSIAPNTFGPGLRIAHRGTLIVSNYARIGENCTIHTCVNIGVKAGTDNKAPVIGNNVYIGPGAKIFGDIIIADSIAIGANSVVNRSFLEQNITIGGVPAIKISDKGSYNL